MQPACESPWFKCCVVASHNSQAFHSVAHPAKMRLGKSDLIGAHKNLIWLSVGGGTSVVECPPLNWKVGCSIHGQWLTRRSAAWARAFTATAPTKSIIQAPACRQLLNKPVALCAINKEKTKNKTTSHKHTLTLLWCQEKGDWFSRAENLNRLSCSRPIPSLSR